jgi:hypothetical protein
MKTHSYEQGVLGESLVLWGVITVTYFTVKPPERLAWGEIFFASVHGGLRG